MLKGISEILHYFSTNILQGCQEATNRSPAIFGKSDKYHVWCVVWELQKWSQWDRGYNCFGEILILFHERILETGIFTSA